MMENIMLIRAAHSTHVNERDTNQYVLTRVQSTEPCTDHYTNFAAGEWHTNEILS